MRLARESPPRIWPRFHGTARSVGLTARVGTLLGACFGICFLTGLLSHYQYRPAAYLPISASPSWGYRATQGLHVITGIALIPLLLVKLWSVFPRLWVWPPVRGIGHALERLSVAVLIASALVEVTTGYLNVLNWYPWPWSFIDVHYWLAYVLAGSILLHIGVQLPAIRRGWSESVNAPDPPDDTIGETPVDAVPPSGITRRGLLVATGAGFGVLTLTTVGQVAPPLRAVELLSVRQPGNGPGGIPINRTATQARVSMVDASYRLHVSGRRPYELSLSELEALHAQDGDYPIACVEGWSANGTWRGPRLLDLVRRAGGDEDSIIGVASLEKDGAFRTSIIRGRQMNAALIATHLNGRRISLDHGYPARLIAPNRAGVLNTKWLRELEVQS